MSEPQPAGVSAKRRRPLIVVGSSHVHLDPLSTPHRSDAAKAARRSWILGGCCNFGPAGCTVCTVQLV